MIQSVRPPSTSPEAARGEYATDEEARAVWANMGSDGPLHALWCPHTFGGIAASELLPYPSSLTSYESHCRRLCCAVRFVGR